jgi:hypothetical protein
VNSTEALASSSRVAVASVPNPEKIGTAIAPVLKQPYRIEMISGTIGMYSATVSPTPMPSDARKFAT